MFGVPLCQAHESVSAFAQACSLGEKESAAAVNLLKHIPTNIKEALTELVRILGLIYPGTYDSLLFQQFYHDVMTNKHILPQFFCLVSLPTCSKVIVLIAFPDWEKTIDIVSIIVN